MGGNVFGSCDKNIIVKIRATTVPEGWASNWSRGLKETNIVMGYTGE